MARSTDPEYAAVPSAPLIGVFDSGVGGLSVLRALRRVLPNHRMLYVADSAHAPYGERDSAHVIDRSKRITRHLIDSGATVVVIACNTATAVAAQQLREAWPELPIVGVEPGIKPALAATQTGRIGVMATAATLGSDKFRRLLNAHQGDTTFHLQACTGLAAAIESADVGGGEVERLVELHCEPMRAADVDTVVLGCTHYPFAEELIRASMGPRVTIIDTANAVSRRVAQVGNDRVEAGSGEGAPAIVLQTTGDVAALRRFAVRWLNFRFECQGIDLNGPRGGARDGA